MAHLRRVSWPDWGKPELPPTFSLTESSDRLAQVRREMRGRGYQSLVIYADREHAANLAWLTGFDPRFEEAILILTETDSLLLAGNECLPYTQISPLVAAGLIRVGHCASLSLPSQPRGTASVTDFLRGIVPRNCKAGAVGWKWFTPAEADAPLTALDIPAFVADPLRAIADRVENATDLFMHPTHGVRARVNLADVARLEFANHQAAAAMKRMIFAMTEGQTDFDAFQAAQMSGAPLGCHPTFATGNNWQQGLSSPTGEKLTLGLPISFNICHWGSNICRAGFVAHQAKDLPAGAQDYVETFVAPYLQAMSDWCAMMTPGTTGGAVWSMIQSQLPHDTFAITLNPGHLIGMDEWMSSPIYKGSGEVLASGMAMQMDVIPSHPIYGSTRMEDGYILADATLRTEIAAAFPDVWRRMIARRNFMRDIIGIQVPDALLPLADTCGIIAPFLLDPETILVL